MAYIKAYVVWGILCVLAQLRRNITKLMAGRILVFGYNLWKGITEAVDKDGFIGLFRGGFQMAAVGSSAALIFGYLASLIFKPKMTK